MSDNRTNIINEVIMNMQNDLNKDQLCKLESVLYIQLDKYEVQERCTDIALSDNSYEKALKRFIATKRLEGKSEKTIRLYTMYCKQMLFTIGKKVDEITTYDLRFYLAEYQEQRKITNRTLENMRRCISSFFSWLFNERIININPSVGLGNIKYEKQVRKPFTADEMEKIKRSCNTARDRAIVEFLYATGCRVSEVTQLDRNDIDFINKKVVVLGKGNKQRTVYITQSCALYLQEYLSTRTDCNPCLFLNKKGQRLTSSGIQNMLHRLEQPSGVTDIHPHRFRRTLATNMISKGAAIQDVSAILGHEDLATTQIYCALDQRDVEYTYQKCIA